MADKEVLDALNRIEARIERNTLQSYRDGLLYVGIAVMIGSTSVVRLNPWGGLIVYFLGLILMMVSFFVQNRPLHKKAS
ncbi:MAG: hypothetical protein Q7K03_03370 [Dehalococcoidia bacterium]|nr:hypothetical protein [Dehalococcoidia bacterium]